MGMQKLFEKLKTGMAYAEVDLPSLITEVGRAQLIQEILTNAGNTNSLIRENMMGIHDRLVDEKLLSKEEYATLFDGSLTNLFKSLGSKDDDLVFTRSFSSLYLAYFADKDEALDLLTQEQYMLLLNKAIDYMQKEVDRRGYVMGKGWAHAPAHGSDLLCCLVENPKFPIEYTDKILDCIKFHITSQDSFAAGEERRLARVIPSLMEKGLSIDALQNWIKSMLPQISNEIVQYTDAEFPYTHTLFNIKYFLYALYYIAGDNKKSAEIRPFIQEYEPKMWKLSRENN